MPWFELAVVCDAAQTADVEAHLEAAGAVSVSLTAAADPLYEPAPGDHPLWARCWVGALFDTADAAGAARESFQRRFAGLISAPRLTAVEERDWVSETQATQPPTRYGRRLWVAPPGRAVEGSGAVVVRMVPGLAFGTGAHETTALCLEWLDAEEIQGRELVDFGCGSGILSIAAALLGAARVWAIDHDPQALRATRANAAANGVVGRILVCGADELPGDLAADLLVANILAGVLADLAPRIVALLAPGGRLALSGILEEQTELVRAAYAAGCREFACARRGGWVRMSATRA